MADSKQGLWVGGQLILRQGDVLSQAELRRRIRLGFAGSLERTLENHGRIALEPEELSEEPASKSSENPTPQSSSDNSSS